MEVRGKASPVIVFDNSIRVSPICAVRSVKVEFGDQYGTLEESLPSSINHLAKLITTATTQHIEKASHGVKIRATLAVDPLFTFVAFGFVAVATIIVSFLCPVSAGIVSSSTASVLSDVSLHFP